MLENTLFYVLILFILFTLLFIFMLLRLLRTKRYMAGKKKVAFNKGFIVINVAPFIAVVILIISLITNLNKSSSPLNYKKGPFLAVISDALLFTRVYPEKLQDFTSIITRKDVLYMIHLIHGKKDDKKEKVAYITGANNFETSTIGHQYYGNTIYYEGWDINGEQHHIRSVLNNMITYEKAFIQMISDTTFRQNVGLDYYVTGIPFSEFENKDFNKSDDIFLIPNDLFTYKSRSDTVDFDTTDDVIFKNRLARLPLSPAKKNDIEEIWKKHLSQNKRMTDKETMSFSKNLILICSADRVNNRNEQFIMELKRLLTRNPKLKIFILEKDETLKRLAEQSDLININRIFFYTIDRVTPAVAAQIKNKILQISVLEKIVFEMSKSQLDLSDSEIRAIMIFIFVLILFEFLLQALYSNIVIKLK